MITFILAVCGNVDYVYSFPLSPPSRAAWIEIKGATATITIYKGSPPSRAAWIEILDSLQYGMRRESPPSRAAWIEIMYETVERTLDEVAAFTGGVD